MTREEQIETVMRVLGNVLGGSALWLAERIVDALAQPVEDEERLTEAEWWERLGERIGIQKAQELGP